MKEVEPAGQPGKPFPACPRGQVSVCPELQTGTWLPQNPGHTIQLRPVPTSRPIDRPTGKHSEGGGREMRAWETKSCPTTGTLHGHASGPGAPFPATPGSRGPAGYYPPSPDPSGLGKKMFPRRRLRRTDPAKEGAGARATLSAPPLTSCAGLDLVSTTPHGPAVAISRGAGGEGPMPA